MPLPLGYEQNNVPMDGSSPRPCEGVASRSSWCGSWSTCWPPPLLGTERSGTTLGRSPWERGLSSLLQGPPRPLTMLPAKVSPSRTSVRCRDLVPGRPSCHWGSAGVHPSWAVTSGPRETMPPRVHILTREIWSMLGGI